MNEAIKNSDFREVRRLVIEHYNEYHDFKIINKNVIQSVLFGTGTETEKIKILDFFNDISRDVPNSGIQLSPTLLYTAAANEQCEIVLYLMRKGIDYSHNNYAGLLKTKGGFKRCFKNIIKEFPETVKHFNRSGRSVYYDDYVLKSSPMEFSVSGIDDFTKREMMVNVYNLSRPLIEIYSVLENPEELDSLLNLEGDISTYYNPTVKDYAAYFTCVERNNLIGLDLLLQYYQDQDLLNRLLAYACYFNDDQTINYLLDKGANLTNEALENATRGNHPDLVKFILKNAKVSNETALLIAHEKDLEGENMLETINKLKFLGRR